MISVKHSLNSVATALRRIEAETDRTVTRAARRPLRDARKAAVDEFKRKGITRSVFGHDPNPKGLEQLVRAWAKARRGYYVVGLTAGGLASLVDRGGKTKAHTIAPRHKTRLMLKPSDRFVSGAVKHPGSRIPADPTTEPLLKRTLPKIETEIEKDLQALIRGEGL